MNRITFRPTDNEGNDMSPELASFAEFIGLTSAAPDRYSILLVLQLYAGMKSGHLYPAKVIYEINALEGSGPPSQLKAPILFKHAPLQGLWHKHYLEDGLSSMAKNLQRGLLKFGIPSFVEGVRESQATGIERQMTADNVKAVVDDVVRGNWLRLGSSASLTGEWIIYADHDSKKYYLCLGKHQKSEHQTLRDQIDAVCCNEFEFLAGLLVKT